jgi:hypothetical protein
VTCTSCQRVPFRPRVRFWTSKHTEAIRSLGWFVYSPDAPVRFRGVVLCPPCRLLPTNLDAYQNVYLTTHLERLASGESAALAQV